MDTTSFAKTMDAYLELRLAVCRALGIDPEESFGMKVMDMRGRRWEVDYDGKEFRVDRVPPSRWDDDFSTKKFRRIEHGEIVCYVEDYSAARSRFDYDDYIEVQTIVLLDASMESK